jgi:molybdate transport repressor ModE-like protein
MSVGRPEGASGPPAILDVGRLRLLREVALRGTIAAAARSLGLSASAVSQQLTVLEREADAALLDRSPRGVTLTGAGLRLAQRAGEVLEVLASARADLDQLADTVSGPVRLASVASAAAALVSPALLALRAAQPDVAVSVLAAEPARSLELLLRGDVDVALVDEYDYVPMAVPDALQAFELLTEELVIVRSLDAAIPAPKRLADLASANWVMPPDDAACGQAVRSACRAAGFEPNVVWETDDMLLLARAVGAGHGVAVLPPLAVADTGGVRATPLRDPVLRRRLVALARVSAATRPVVSTVLAQLQATANQTRAATS